MLIKLAFPGSGLLKKSAPHQPGGPGRDGGRFGALHVTCLVGHPPLQAKALQHPHPKFLGCIASGLVDRQASRRFKRVPGEGESAHV